MLPSSSSNSDADLPADPFRAASISRPVDRLIWLIWGIGMLGIPFQFTYEFGASQIESMTEPVSAGLLVGCLLSLLRNVPGKAVTRIEGLIAQTRVRAVCLAVCLMLLAPQMIALATGSPWGSEALATLEQLILATASVRAPALFILAVLWVPCAPIGWRSDRGGEEEPSGIDRVAAPDRLGPTLGLRADRRLPLWAAPAFTALCGALTKALCADASIHTVSWGGAGCFGLRCIAAAGCALAALSAWLPQLLSDRLLFADIPRVESSKASRRAAGFQVACIAAYALGSLGLTLLLRAVYHVGALSVEGSASVLIASAVTIIVASAASLLLVRARDSGRSRAAGSAPSDEGRRQNQGSTSRTGMILSPIASGANESDSIERLRRALSERGLAPREAEVAAWTVCGHSSEEVGGQLGIKPSSVRSTLHRVYRKLGVRGARGLSACCASGVSDGEDGAAAATPSEAAALDMDSASITPAERGRGLRASIRRSAPYLLLAAVLLSLFRYTFGREWEIPFARMILLLPARLIGVGLLCASLIGSSLEGGGSPRRPTIPISLYAAAAMLFTMLYTPGNLYFGTWGFARMTVLGSVVGCVLFGCGHCYGSWVRAVTAGDRKSALSAGARHVLRRASCIIVCFMAAAVFMGVACATEMRFCSRNLMPNFASLVEFWTFAAGTILLLVLVSSGMREQRWPQSPRSMSAAAMLLAFGWFCAEEAGAPFFEETVAVASILLVMSALWDEPPSRTCDRRGDAHPAQTTFATVALCALTSACGLAWEELWRSLSTFSGIASVPLLIVPLGIAAGWLVRGAGRGTRRVALLLMCSIGLSFVSDFISSGDIPLVPWTIDLPHAAHIALPLASAFFLCILMHRARELRVLSRGAIGYLALSAAAGAGGGYLLMNRLGRTVPDITSKTPISFEGAGALSSVTVVFSVLFLLSGVLALLLCRHLTALDQGRRMVSRSGLDERSLRDRMRACFVSRGATETQALVLTEVALGRTTAEICERLHYAPGTVNVARARGYRMLHVHDRMAFQKTIDLLLDV